MIKKIFFIIAFFFFFTPSAYAKVWTKDLVDSITLESGYKLSICSINLSYDRTNSADNIFDATEKEFEANPDSYPCNKKTQEDILFANITLHFSKKNWGGGEGPQKLIEFKNKLYSVDSYSDVLTDQNGKDPIGDISPVDWLSKMAGIHGIRGDRLINTDPTATLENQSLPNSHFLIMHSSTDGTFPNALFVFNGTVYKIASVISKVTEKATLVDYSQQPDSVSTVTSEPSLSITHVPTSTIQPSLTATPTITPIQQSSVKIDSVTPNQGKVGDTIVITGSGFGKSSFYYPDPTQFKGMVSFFGPSGQNSGGAPPAETGAGWWSDTQIKVKIPGVSTDTTFQIEVTSSDGQKSSRIPFTVTN